MFIFFKTHNQYTIVPWHIYYTYADIIMILLAGGIYSVMPIWDHRARVLWLQNSRRHNINHTSSLIAIIYKVGTRWIWPFMYVKCVSWVDEVRYISAYPIMNAWIGGTYLTKLKQYVYVYVF